MITKRHFKWMLAIALTLAGLTFSATAQAAEVGSLNQYTAETPLIISHRGSPLQFPEHSFAGYNDAIQNGSKFIEQDVILAKDNHLVVSHDNNLKKNTGHNISVTNSTYGEIRKAPLSNGETIHTLGSIFNRYQQSTNYVVETKKTAKGGYLLETEIAASIKEHHVENNVVLQSFSLSSLKYLHNLLPNAPEMLALSGDNSNANYLSKLLSQLPSYINIVAVYTPGVTTQDVQLIHMSNKKAVGYALDTDTELANGQASGLDGLFTDNTKLATGYFEK